MSSSSQIVESWITTYCSLLGHEYLAEVSEDFIEDDFNLTGLSSQVSMYKEALELILDIEPEDDSDIEDSGASELDDDDAEAKALAYRRSGERRRQQPDKLQIDNSAELLYGLIHQRYITSRAGMAQMHEKYEMGHFGVCPRILCQGSKVLPVGCSDSPGEDTVKLFCPSCLDIYNPPNSRFHGVDGAYFGTTFGSLFFMSFPELQLTSSAAELNAASPGRLVQPPEINGTNVGNFAPGLGKGKVYEAKIYGFRVSERARTGPRMKWLRQKPQDVRELDESARYLEDKALDEQGAEEDEEEDELEGQEEGAVDEREYVQHVEGRKKAPMRRRRVGSAASAGGV
jgi:casein kinase II subunit beta